MRMNYTLQEWDAIREFLFVEVWNTMQEIAMWMGR